MRYVAQVSMVVLALLATLWWKSILVAIVLYSLAAPVCVLAVAWYVIFDLPFEVADRHAEKSRVYVDASALRTRTGPLGM